MMQAQESENMKLFFLTMAEYETVKTISSGKLFHKCMTIREKQAK